MCDTVLRTSVCGMRELISRFRFADQVMGFCKACPIYGLNWSCPPFNFDVDEFLRQFNYAYLFGVKMIHDEATVASMNTEEKAVKYAMWLMGKVNLKLLEILHDLERQYPGSRGASGGECKICPSCARREGAPCRFPEKMRNSIESLGFNVSMIAEELLGLKLLWFKGSLPPYQVLVNALFTKERHDEIIFD